MAFGGRRWVPSFRAQRRLKTKNDLPQDRVGQEATGEPSMKVPHACTYVHTQLKPISIILATPFH